jgi:hypothetical protein
VGARFGISFLESKNYKFWDTSGDPTRLAVRIRPTGVKSYVVFARLDSSRRLVMLTSAVLAR